MEGTFVEIYRKIFQKILLKFKNIYDQEISYHLNANQWFINGTKKKFVIFFEFG
jgi:DNA-directed RNA polymerase subunit E'/Rpb7